MHETLESVIQSEDFPWHQGGVIRGLRTRGASDTQTLIEGCPALNDLSGKSVLDIGTTNGLVAFEAEARGATRVVATDIHDDGHFGFSRLKAALDSNVEFVRCNVYNLNEALGGEQFDVVIFWGVLYHLRHPLLALDQVRQVSRAVMSCETAIAISPQLSSTETWCKYYERAEFAGDATNWFVPSAACARAWLRGSGFTTVNETIREGNEFGRMMVDCQVNNGPAFYEEQNGEPRIVGVKFGE